MAGIKNYFKNQMIYETLKKHLNPQTIVMVNDEVKWEIEKLKHGKRGSYSKLMPAQKATYYKSTSSRAWSNSNPTILL